MKSRITFYLLIFSLVVLDSVLLRSPNLLGKIGLIVYNYHYLRTFPKALLTVSLVVGGAVVIGEVIRFLVKRSAIKRITGKVVLIVLMALVAAVFVKTAIDFTAWSYSHTGLRFRIGAHVLPAILFVVFFYTYSTLPKIHRPFPESPSSAEGGTSNKTIIPE